MKKVIITLCALVLGTAAANAQNGLGGLLGSIFGKAKENTENTTGGTSLGDILGAAASVLGIDTGNAVNLVGTWTYNGSAIALESDNVLSNVAGTAAVGAVENKIDELLGKVGIQPGIATFTFAEDGTFAMNAGTLNLGGTWTKTEGQVVLEWGKTMKYLKMEGNVAMTSDGCQLLFKSSKFLKFVKNVLKVFGSKSSTASTLAALLNNYDNMKLGFKLKK